MAPVLGAVSLSQSIVNENGSITLNGSFTDVNSLDTHTVEITWGDGTTSLAAVNAANRTFTASHQYLDDGPNPGNGVSSHLYTIGVKVTDDDGAVAEVTSAAAVTVKNVAPQLQNVTITPSIDENEFATLSGDIIDPGTLDMFTLVVDWGDGSAPQNYDLAAGSTSFSVSHQYLDDNPTGTASATYNVSIVSFTDDDGADALDMNKILFIDDDRNLNGQGTWLALLNDLGYDVTYEAIASDGNPTNSLSDFDTVIWSIGDQAYTNLTGQNVATLTSYLNGGGKLLYAGGHNLYDEPNIGSFAANYLGVSSYHHNMPYVTTNPNATGVGGNYTLNAWAAGAYGGTMISAFAATGSTSLMELSGWNSSANDIAAVKNTSTFSAATWAFDINQLGAQYREAFLASTLDAMNVVPVIPMPITVNNLAPSFEAGVNETLLPPAAGTFSRTLGFSDPGTLDEHVITVNFGDGSGAQTFSAGTVGTRSFDLNHTFTADGTFTVSVTVEDDDLGTYTDTFAVEVILNTPPQANAGGPYTIDEGLGLALDASATTDEQNNITSYAWDLDNDGQFDDAFGATPSLTWNDLVALGIDDDGLYAVTVLVEDAFGASSTTGSTIIVNNVAPKLTVSGQTSINEGSTYSLTLGSSDPGADTISQWFIDWGDGSDPDNDGVVGEIVAGNPTSVTHIYVDGPRTYTILATATDEDGTYEATAFGGNAIVSPDPSFGDGGEVRTDLFGSTADNTIDLSIVLPDGKVLVAGRAVGGNSNIALAQYLPNGDLDANFGTGGKVFTELGGEEYTEALVVDSSGRITVGGNYGMVRYLADGSLDNTFGVNGLLTILTNVRDLALDSQQRIVASTGYYVQRFNSDSSVDQSFNNGQILYTYNLMGGSYSEDMTVDASDRIVLIGNVYNSFSDNPATSNFNENNNSHYDMIVGRLTSAGQLDTSFAASGPTSGGYANVTYHSGYARIDFSGRSDYGNTVILQGSDIVVGGYTQPLYNSVGQTYFDPAGQSRHDADVALLRLDASGALDTSFAVNGAEGDGLVQTHLGSWEYAYSLGLGSQSELLVGTSSGFWTRYSADGILDISLNPTSSYPGRVSSYVSTVYGIQEWVDSGTGDRFVFTSGNRYIGGNEGSNFAVAKHKWNDGNLDPTFGLGGSDNISGVVNTDFQGSQRDEVRDLVLTQPDGKILVAGYKSGGVTQLVLARYNGDGSLDGTFGASDGDGVDGVVIDDRYQQPEAMAVDANGKIVISYSNQLLRYNADGTPDNTFGSNPWSNNVYVGGQLSYTYSLVVDAAGKIIAAGYRYQASPDATISSADLAIARYNVDGTLDMSFSNGDADGVDGVNLLDLGSSGSVRSEEYLQAITIDSSGNILATGYSYAYDYNTNQYVRRSDIVLVRYNADGTLDSSFGIGSSSNSDNTAIIENIDGVVLTDFNKNGWEYGYAVTVDSQGRIYAGGDNYLAAYNPDGTLDTHFAGGKINVTGSIRSLAIDAAGQIVMAGNNRLSRYLTDGTPDTDFAANGTLYINDRSLEAVAIDNTGRILVGGRTGSSGPSGVDFFVARYLTGGLSVTVNNVAPQNVSVTGTTSTDEGQLISLSASATDPAGIYDPLTYTWSITRNNVAFLQTSGQNIFFTAPDDGTYVATMTVDDGDGGSVTVSHTTVVANLNPTPLIDSISTTRVEGTQIDVVANATDPAGANDTLTYSYEVFKDGSTTAFASDSGVDQTNFSFTPDDNGSYEIVLTVSDEDGGSAAVSQIITVNNLNPTPLIDSISATRVEGTQIDVVANATDPAGTNDTLTYSYEVFKDGSTTAFASGSGVDQTNFSFTPDDNGSYEIVLTVSDEDGGSAAVSQTITVNNVAPQNVNAGADQTVDEGATVSLVGSFSDPGSADTHTQTWSVVANNGQTIANGNGGNFLFVPNDNGSYVITYTVVDNDGGETSDEVVVTVNNVAPIVNAGADVAINEGSTFIGSGSFTDPGADTWTAMVDYGDGSGVQPLTLNSDKTFSLSHVYADNGVYTVTVFVTDDDNGSTSDTVDITVNNAIPVITGLSVDSAVIDENGSVTISGSFTDVGTQDTHTVLIDWGNGEVSSAAVVIQGNGSGTFTATHQYLDDNPTGTASDAYTITATVTDDDGGDSASSTVDITVNNVIPVLNSVVSTADAVCDSSADGHVSISGTFTDIGTLDTHTVLVNWGDGSPVQSVPVNQFSDSFIGSHLYATGGIFVITITAVDDDGGTSVNLLTTAVVQGVGVVDGTLYIIGTDGRDHVNLKFDKKNDDLKVDVKLNQGDGDGGMAHINQTYTASSIDRIVAFLCDGDDHYNGDVGGGNGDGSDAMVSQFVFGGAGNDHIRGGRGNDVLSGGSGDDILEGGDGRDILIGGTGKDKLKGGDGNDLLIGGSAASDDDFASLDAALANWVSGDLAAVLVDLGTLTDDGDKDDLKGEKGLDYLIGGFGDKLKE